MGKETHSQIVLLETIPVIVRPVTDAKLQTLFIFCFHPESLNSDWSISKCDKPKPLYMYIMPNRYSEAKRSRARFVKVEMSYHRHAMNCYTSSHWGIDGRLSPQTPYTLKVFNLP